MSNILQEIIQYKHQELAEKQKKTDLDALLNKLEELEEMPRDFYQALSQKVEAQQAAVIAEIKKASPSKGVICKNFHPQEIATTYHAGGATCLSVLTDQHFFQGNDAYIQSVKEMCLLPVLRKEFIISEYQVIESRVLQADCILLIVAALDNAQLLSLTRMALDLGMQVLVEVHNEEELKRALDLPIKIIGINNRNLIDFSVDIHRCLELKAQVPDHYLVVAESGISSREDVASLRQAGIYAYLVGEGLLKHADRCAAIQELFF